MNGIEGRLDWDGPDPDVIRLTDDGKRKVQIRIAWRRFQLSVTVRNVTELVEELQAAQAWTQERVA